MLPFQRMKQRKLIQWTVAYLGAAWLVIEGLSMLAGPFGWPSAVIRIATVLAAVGLIAVIIVAWYHGERGQQTASGTELLLLGVVLILAAAAVYWARGDRDDSAEPNTAPATDSIEIDPRSVAVLPFTDLSAARNQEYFSEGIAEEIINALSKIEGLRVAARGSSFSFKGSNTPVDEVGRRLRVASVLEGSVSIDGPSLKVNVHLADARNGYQLWSERYDRTMEDVFAVQDDISRAVARALEVELVVGDRGLVTRSTASSEAYAAYLRGLFQMRQRTPDALRRAIGHFEEAIAHDQSFARAYSGLADALVLLPLYSDTRVAEIFERARAAVLKALSLDSTLADAHASLGYILMHHDNDWRVAASHFEQALQLNPGYAPGLGWYGDYLGAIGRLEEGLAMYQRAQELNPLSPVIGAGIAWVHMAQRRHDEAIAQINRTLALDSTFLLAHQVLARTRLYQGRADEAITRFHSIIGSDSSSMNLAFLGNAYAIAGKRADALRVLDDLTQRSRSAFVPALAFAIVYTGLGDVDRAFQSLDKAALERDPWLTENNFDRVFDPLRGDPRFVGVLSKLGLEGYPAATRR